MNLFEVANDVQRRKWSQGQHVAKTADAIVMQGISLPRDALRRRAQHLSSQCGAYEDVESFEWMLVLTGSPNCESYAESLLQRAAWRRTCGRRFIKVPPKEFEHGTRGCGRRAGSDPALCGCY
jgi:hypothetical protein